MSDTNDSARSVRTASGRFAKGNPGGPGRPRATATTAELDQMGIEVAAELLRVAIEKARGGDAKALDLVLSRVWPQRRGRAIEFEAPSVADFQGILAAHTQVANGVLAGHLTAPEAKEIGEILERQRELVNADTACRTMSELVVIALRDPMALTRCRRPQKPEDKDQDK